MKPSEPKDGERSGSREAGTVTPLKRAAGPPEAPARQLPSRPVPAWDITDEEISEWQHSRSGIPGVVLAGHVAAAIRDGRRGGGELFPPSSEAYREVTKETVDSAMEMLMERGMVRKSGAAWYPVTPGRPAPSARRAVAILLAMREDLPSALAAELHAYQATLDAIIQPEMPLHQIAAG
jgi:hypothetical protein